MKAQPKWPQIDTYLTFGTATLVYSGSLSWLYSTEELSWEVLLFENQSDDFTHVPSLHVYQPQRVTTGQALPSMGMRVDIGRS